MVKIAQLSPCCCQKKFRNEIIFFCLLSAKCLHSYYTLDCHIQLQGFSPWAMERVTNYLTYPKRWPYLKWFLLEQKFSLDQCATNDSSMSYKNFVRQQIVFLHSYSWRKMFVSTFLSYILTNLITGSKCKKLGNDFLAKMEFEWFARD